MKLFEFTITIDQYVENLDVIDAFYGRTGDASLAASEGRTLIHFDREANSLDEALRSAMIDIKHQGWQASAIAVDPGCISPSLTA